MIDCFYSLLENNIMPLIQCSKCGGSYPDALSACPKCGMQTPEDSKTHTKKYKNFRYIFAAELLLIVAGIIGMTHFSFITNSGDFILFLFLFISGIILVIITFLVLLYRKGDKELFWIFFVLIGVAALILFKSIIGDG